MRLWSVERLGEPREALEIKEKQMPEREENEVCIKVEAAALNFFDILLCQGKYQEKPPIPFTFGSEISGVITEANEGGAFKIGQRVMALPKMPKGGLAEYVSVPEDHVFPIPDSIPWGEAAAFSITYRTSYYALVDRAKLQAGEVLLVHAGAGGVGSAAIQLGKAIGATVIATAGGPEKVKVCKDIGADIVIDYLAEDFVSIVKSETNGKGADVIYDPVGGDVFDKSRKCIAFDGRILVIGFAEGRIPTVATNHILIKNYSVVGVHYGLYAKLFPEKVHEAHQSLMILYNEGKINPLIYNEYAFNQVPEVLDLLGTRKTWGKAIIKVNC
ncbi:NADPH:quinone oxidoreductase family protein [Bacillus sp. CRN 9]|uniref:NADPH:quinone oxidoreductase family protein n=1 Tax=Cytobacillus horneckiae TaxID=549687 RepID=UPI00156292CF|nr:NADPH:quinone oxidoreductase family protein [Bacillus sp. CRN 9]